jgi:thioredoxin reductase (NADPH)
LLDFDAVIIGGGPAGLTAGLYLSRSRYKTLLIDKEGFGGNVNNVEWIENYPGFSGGISGAQLSAEMMNQAIKYGLQMEMAQVAEIELYSGSRCVQLADGRSFTAEALIIASGCKRKKLKVPGEQEFEGKGIIECALCDGDQFQDKSVIVCGGGDTGITEALYLTKIAARVLLLEAEPCITASAVLQERAKSNQKLSIRCSAKVAAILGDERVKAIEIEDTSTHKKEIMQTEGILVDIGMTPNTGFLKNMVPLDNQQRILVDEKMESSVPWVFAVGDVRSNSPGQVVTAVGDGATAAIAVQQALQKR